MTRREWIAVAGAVPLLKAAPNAPAAPVALARCASYNEDTTAVLSSMFEKLGGLGRIVSGKTVTVKLNLTGSPGLRFQGRPPGVTHYVHPKLVGSLAHLMGKRGGAPDPLCRKRVGQRRAARGVHAGRGLERARAGNGGAARGVRKHQRARQGQAVFAASRCPAGGYIFPAYDLNHAYEDTDVFVSMAKLKDHETCGVTFSLKNCFGNTPASIYGDDAGRDEPNESPGKGRVETFHFGKRQPSKSAPQEIDPSSSREPGYRVPRIVADLVAARPVDLAIIDGIESVAGGEGPWIKGLRLVQPGVLIAGTNPVCTDAVAAQAMGYDPRATRGTAPFGQLR